MFRKFRLTDTPQNTRFLEKVVAKYAHLPKFAVPTNYGYYTWGDLWIWRDVARYLLFDNELARNIEGRIADANEVMP